VVDERPVGNENAQRRSAGMGGWELRRGCSIQQSTPVTRNKGCADGGHWDVQARPRPRAARAGLPSIHRAV